MPLVWLWTFLSKGITVLVNLLFLLMLVAVVAAVFYTPHINVPHKSALVLAPEGDIVEERSPMDPMTKLINNVAGVPIHEETFLQDVLDVVTEAAQDDRIAMLLLKTDRLGSASLDQIKAIGGALESFKGAGKKVIAYGDSFNQAQYYLASWADAIYLNPMGAVNLRGFSVFRLYMREMLEKLAVDFHVFRVGTFKSALALTSRQYVSRGQGSQPIVAGQPLAGLLRGCEQAPEKHGGRTHRQYQHPGE